MIAPPRPSVRLAVLSGLATTLVSGSTALAKPVVRGDFTSQGGIVVLPEIDDPPVHIPGTPAEIDIDGDGSMDVLISSLVWVYFENEDVCLSFGGSVAALDGGEVWRCGKLCNLAWNFADGEIVGPALEVPHPDPGCPGLAPLGNVFTYDCNPDDFGPGATRTAGFSIVRNGQTHWGWVHIMGGSTSCGAPSIIVMSYGYETTPDMPVLAHAPTCHDLTGDTLVDSADLSALLAAFGQSDEGDLDGDGITSSTDLNLILADFGAGCEALGSCCIGGECEHLTIDECGAAGGTLVGNQVACATAACE